MPCYHPIDGWYSKDVNPSGKRSIVFNMKQGLVDRYIRLPCGRCIGCRLERSRQWAVRCVHEASLYKDNCFLTLTYSPENVPEGGSLYPRHFVLFMKRLRKKFGSDIRFFQCGEYGELLKRPHHHVCLFNFDFPDKVLFSMRNKIPLYRSSFLEKLWPYGFSSIGAVTFDSAAYVARYIVKKVNGDLAEDHYKGLVPEYITMSRKPGIGANWFKKFSSDVYPSDCVISKNFKAKPPRYYDKIFDLTNNFSMSIIKGKRIIRGKQFEEDSTSERLLVREEVQRLKFNNLSRSYEST